MTGPTIVLSAGGTGGHMFPAEALARTLLAEGCTVRLITDDRGGAFGGALPEVAVDRIAAAQIGRGPIGKLKTLAAMARGYRQAGKLLRRAAPAAVVGFGGYATWSTMTAACARRLPTAIHEQNAVLGRVNRRLASRVDRIATAFPDVSRLPADRADRAVQTGNPVRPAVLAAASTPYPVPSGGAPLRLVVVGGSQGARVLSQVVPPALAALPEDLRRRLSVTQQCRPEDLDGVRNRYGELAIAADCASFFDDIPQRLAAGHLAICRSGASTVAELTVIGRPAILVPYPLATDDHQMANARALVEAGGARAIPQPEFSVQRLADELGRLLADPAGLARAAAAAHATAYPDAAARLAQMVIGLATGGSRASRGAG